MLLLSFVVGAVVTCCLLWIGYVISCLSKGIVNNSNIVILMGLFLPLIVIGIAFAFAYLATEMKKTQIVLQKVLQKNALPQTQHPLAGENNTKEKTSVVSISMNDPINKYKEVTLPDDVNVRFEK